MLISFRKKYLQSSILCKSLSSLSFDFKSKSNSKYFEFKSLESDIYSWWDSSGHFRPNSSSKSVPFVIPMPPPNVTGSLHMGHAIFVSLQDILARFHRMRGRPTLWLPGTDHAGIATQLLVEKQLQSEGLSRQMIGRTEFLKRVWEWKEEKGGYIIDQMKRLGASADWSRTRFTMDPQMSEAVTEAFLRLHDRGLIYRGSYMVNWSPNLQTAVSDLEVEHVEEKGTLYTFKYPLLSEEGDSLSGEFIPVATTRPETILGDSALCVHPDDPRYQRLVGRRARVPTTDRSIPGPSPSLSILHPVFTMCLVISDPYVDPSFGSGALKVTPAHDPKDYDLGQKHSLPLISVMNKDGSINEKGGRYSGLDRFQCRKEIWRDLEGLGLAIKSENHMQRVPRSQRGGEVIEPMVSSQWFLRTQGMADRALQASRDGSLRFVPPRYEKVWEGWMERLHDWCISRQLWWGHRIPVYYVLQNSNSELVGDEPFVVARSLEEATKKAVEQFGSQVRLVQDGDVLDTWFSSGLWPFSTLGWPHSDASDPTSDLSRFYPASVLETGNDILFFWVARMVMMGIELTGQTPFHIVYLHGLVRDAEGHKMSKTKGNVIDPLVETDKHGADALRFALVSGTVSGQDVAYSNEKIQQSVYFVNKLWNIGKYIEMVTSSPSTPLKPWATSGSPSLDDLSALPVSERFIISRCHSVIEQATLDLEANRFAEAGTVVHDFLWDEFADWFVEVSKTRTLPEDRVSTLSSLVYVWNCSLRLLHPFMPFLTETLWQAKSGLSLVSPRESIMVSPWPLLVNSEQNNSSLSSLPIDPDAVDHFSTLQSIIKAVRNARAEHNVDPTRKISAHIQVRCPRLLDSLRSESAVLAFLGRISDVHLSDQSASILTPTEGNDVHLVVQEGVEVVLPFSSLVDLDKERERLTKQSEKLQKEIDLFQTQLNGSSFKSKAPAKLVAEIESKLADRLNQLSKIKQNLSQYR